jgi:hypothetical protein
VPKKSTHNAAMAQTGMEKNKTPLAIVSERTVNEKKDGYRKVFFFIIWENCMKIVTTGQIFLSNYELPRSLK